MSSSVLELPTNHPGVSDPEYVERRNHIAQLTTGAVLGARPPLVDYTPVEHQVWSTVHAALELTARRIRGGRISPRCGCARSAHRQGSPAGRCVRSSDRPHRLAVVRSAGPRVNRRVLRRSRRSLLPLIAVRPPFVGAVLHSRPDIIHELIGHANSLASPRIAGLYERAGQVASRLTDPKLADLLGRVFWFTLEFGVATEDGALRTYGAGLLSSFGEITNFRNAEVRPFDTAAMGEFDDYEISTFQDVLFAAASFDEAEARLFRFLDEISRA